METVDCPAESTHPRQVSQTLQSLSAAVWVDLASCTEDEPYKGAAPVETIRLCGLTADAFDTIDYKSFEAVRIAQKCVEEKFSPEVALAYRLCDLMHVEVLSLCCTAAASTPADNLLVIVRLLASVLKLFRCSCNSGDDEATNEVASDALMKFPTWQLVRIQLQEIQLQGLFWSSYLDPERWEEVSNQLDPLADLVRSIDSWLGSSWRLGETEDAAPLFHTIVAKYEELTDSLEAFSSRTASEGKRDEVLKLKLPMMARKRAVVRKILDELKGGDEYILALADRLDALMHFTAASNAGMKLQADTSEDIKQVARLLHTFVQAADLSPIAKPLAKQIVSSLVRACYVRSPIRVHLQSVLDMAMLPELIRDSCQELISLITAAYSYSTTEEEGLSWSVFFASGNLAQELESALGSSNNPAGASDDEKARLLHSMRDIQTRAQARMNLLGKSGGFVAFSEFINSDDNSELSEELFSATPSEFESSDDGEDLDYFIDDTPEYNNQGFFTSILDKSLGHKRENPKDGKLCAQLPTTKLWWRSRAAFSELDEVAESLVKQYPPPDIPQEKFTTKPRPKRPRLV
mmetsp:Transcript_15129/g.32622  ORF Transcript_15129/g.32622 Transcript_15129/m.32622 type:complete len:577 (+) Transcript_15129:95-1825(+)